MPSRWLLLKPTAASPANGSRTHHPQPPELLLRSYALNDGGQVVRVRPHLRKEGKWAGRFVPSKPIPAVVWPMMRTPASACCHGQPPLCGPTGAARCGSCAPWPSKRAPFRAERPPGCPPPAHHTQGRRAGGQVDKTAGSQDSREPVRSGTAPTAWSRKCCPVQPAHRLHAQQPLIPPAPHP